MWPGKFEQIFIPQTLWRLCMKFVFKQPSVFRGKEIWKCWIWVTLDDGQWMLLTLSSHKLSCIHLFDYMYRLSHYRIHQFLGCLQFKCFPIHKQKGPIELAVKCTETLLKLNIYFNVHFLQKTKYFQSLILKLTSLSIWLDFDAIIKMFYHTLAVTSNEFKSNTKLKSHR